MLVEVALSTLSVGLAEPPAHGNKELTAARAYMVATCAQLLEDLPSWGLARGNEPSWRVPDLLEWWRQELPEVRRRLFSFRRLARGARNPRGWPTFCGDYARSGRPGIAAGQGC